MSTRASRITNFLAAAAVLVTGSAFVSGKTFARDENFNAPNGAAAQAIPPSPTPQNPSNLIAASEQQTPSEADGYYDKGVQDVRNQNWDQALENFKNALKYSPDTPLYLLGQGYAEFRKAGALVGQGDRKQAFEFYNMSLGDLLSSKRLYEQYAKIVCKCAVSRSPIKADYVTTLNNIGITFAARGVAWAQEGKPDKAFGDFVRAAGYLTPESAKLPYDTALAGQTEIPQTPASSAQRQTVDAVLACTAQKNGRTGDADAYAKEATEIGPVVSAVRSFVEHYMPLCSLKF